MRPRPRRRGTLTPSSWMRASSPRRSGRWWTSSAQKIDITDSSVVLQYGAAAQKNIAGFSENALNNVRTKDLGEVGRGPVLSGGGTEGLRQGGRREAASWASSKRSGNKLEAMKTSYAKAEANVDKIVRVLENHQVALMKDIAMLDQMYDLNTKYYKELTMYIHGGQEAAGAGPGPRAWRSCRRRPPRPGPRRTPRHTTTMPTCVTALRRSSTIWSSPG